MENFTYSLNKEITHKGVTIQLYNSTSGWFVETSEGLISEYFATKKEATNYIKTQKKLMTFE